MATVLKAEAGRGAGELARRIEQIARDWRLLSVGELGRRADAARGLAMLEGMLPIARIAGGLADALAAHGRGATVPDYCAAMRELLAGDPYDAVAGDAFLAAVSVRLG